MTPDEHGAENRVQTDGSTSLENIQSTANKDSSTPVPAGKITVSLVTAAAEDLERMKNLTGLSKTDLVNKAIQLYAFVSTELRSGGKMIIRHSDNETQVHLL